MFHTFRQNNSGGSFHYDADVDVYVIVEGKDIHEITRRAGDIGIYFNGCDTGTDCSCWGDRWDEPCSNEHLDKTPSIYRNRMMKKHMTKEPTNDSNTVIHYLNGTRMYANSDTAMENPFSSSLSHPRRER